MVKLAPQTLVSFGLTTGDVVSIETSDGTRREVQVAKASDKSMNTSVLQMAAAAQQLYSLGTQQKVKLIPKQITLPECRAIYVAPMNEDTADAVVGADAVNGADAVVGADSEPVDWPKVLAVHIVWMGLISPGLEIKATAPDRQKRTFKVIQVDNTAALKVFRVGDDVKIDLQASRVEDGSLRVDDSKSQICGLEDVLRRLQNRFSAFEGNNNGLRRWQGVILHGPAGTGKSMLIECVLKAKWRAKLEVDYSFTKQMFDEVIDGALKSQPAVIAVHDLIATAKASPDAAPTAFSRLLQAAFKRIAGARILMIAACRSLSNIDQDLRNVEHFGFRFAIPMPTTATRAEILKVKCGKPRDGADSLLDRIAGLTHGFVGRDLVDLVQQAEATAEERVQNESKLSESEYITPEGDTVGLIMGDFSQALKLVAPSALREIVIETPNIRWGDVAGQMEAKKILEKAITWPLKVSLVYVSRIVFDLISMPIFSRNTTSNLQRVCFSTDRLVARKQ